MSYPRNSRSAAASPSRRTVADAPQEGQRHRCLPADVFPFLFIFAPQDGHFTDFTAGPPEDGFIASKRGYLPADPYVYRTHLSSECLKPDASYKLMKKGRLPA